MFSILKLYIAIQKFLNAKCCFSFYVRKTPVLTLTMILFPKETVLACGRQPSVDPTALERSDNA